MNELTLNWDRPPEVHINGVLTFYSIRYHIVGTDDFMFTITNGGSQSLTLEQLSNYTEYEVLIAAGTINGTGPFVRKTERTRQNGE